MKFQIYVFQWIWGVVLIYLVCGWNVYWYIVVYYQVYGMVCRRSNVTSRKSTDFRLHFIVIDKPQSLNAFTICFFFFLLQFWVYFEIFPIHSHNINQCFLYLEHFLICSKYMSLPAHKSPYICNGFCITNCICEYINRNGWIKVFNIKMHKR